MSRIQNLGRHSRYGLAVAACVALSSAAGSAATAGSNALGEEQADLFLEQKVLGPLAIEPATGDFDTNIFVTTAGGCPRGTNTLTRLYGPKLSVDGENVIGNSEVIEFGSPPADRMRVPLTINLAEVARRQLKSVTLQGTYTLDFNCQTPLPVSLDELYGRYVGKLLIKDGRYTALTTVSDLPKEPRPKAGNDAIDLLERVGPPAPEDPRLLDPTAAKEAAGAQETTQLTTSEAAEGGGSASTALIVMAGVLAAGLGGFAVHLRRSRTYARRGSQ